MLGGAGIELVRRENLGARQQFEPRLRDDEMEVPGLCAYGAIAVFNLQAGRCYDLEPDPAAVTASTVRDHLHCRPRVLNQPPAVFRRSAALRGSACFV
jgi:hypothetical protein